jgi:soluble lytic murein transglycosylase
VIIRIKRTHLRIVFFGFIFLVLLLFAKSALIGKLIYPFPHRALIMEYANKNQIDPYLVAAIIRTESKFDSKAESAKGARGIMQLMPETASWAAHRMGIKHFNTNQLFDPETNIKIGCWYLANLSKEFKGNHVLVIASYNGGRGNVKNWLESEVWTGEKETLKQIPFPETKAYVGNVLNNWEKYLEYWRD